MVGRRLFRPRGERPGHGLRRGLGVPLSEFYRVLKPPGSWSSRWSTPPSSSSSTFTREKAATSRPNRWAWSGGGSQKACGCHLFGDRWVPWSTPSWAAASFSRACWSPSPTSASGRPIRKSTRDFPGHRRVPVLWHASPEPRERVLPRPQTGHCGVRSFTQPHSSGVVVSVRRCRRQREIRMDLETNSAGGRKVEWEVERGASSQGRWVGARRWSHGRHLLPTCPACQPVPGHLALRRLEWTQCGATPAAPAATPPW